jgi:hypothetical protein
MIEKLKVLKDIWLAEERPDDVNEWQIISWTSKKPLYHNGFIKAGTVLYFRGYYDTVMVYEFDDNEARETAEFIPLDFEVLIKEKAAEVLKED